MAAALGDERYVSVTTYRKDGSAVATPLWVVADGDALAVWTPAEAGKVKRIRRDPAVTVAPCSFRGELHGDPRPGRAELLGPEDTERIRRLLTKKYGLTGLLTVWGSKLRRGAAGTVGIRITLGRV